MKKLGLSKKNEFNQDDIYIKEQFYTAYQEIEMRLQGRSAILMVTSFKQLPSIVLSTANLALVIAEQQKRVLLIDANLHQPSLHRVFHKKNSSGFGTLLLGGENKHNVKPIKVANNLYCLPAETTSYYPASLLRFRSLQEMIQAWKEQYDVILFHTSNYLNEQDARIIARHCSAIILILKEGHDKLSKLLEVKKDLKTGNEIIGSIVIS
ncbi:CpsD/CapB family tyrosine-protein kinase [Ureibacillus acetophenoni]|uniref:Mrp family chromosome partitioning ATPase n=1 Tax=Ureibacillus acetophenoni TaxID=614649 RepID=A0A285UAL5_9BACL|nr:CpsD/CapB family tyrosine-protein kinase [Ureibacillus acetophenoni]SOC38468.1 Mrp family chromosome partitioning ATPase [Ureibacillus acetophenoni]